VSRAITQTEKLYNNLKKKTMTPEEMEKALDEKFKAVQADLQKAQESGKATDEEIAKLTALIEKSGNALEEFIKEQNEKGKQSIKEQFSAFLNENKDEIAKLHKTGSGTIEFIPKAVGDMSTASGIDVAPLMSPVGHTDLGHFNLRNDDDLLTYATVSSTGKATMSYTELTPKDGDYTFVAEGAEKPPIDFKWENRFPTPYKIAAYEVLSEEVVTDVTRLESVAKEYLEKKHGLFKANKAYFGLGNGSEAKGATKYGRVFSAGDMALKVVKPTFMDVVNAAVVDISTTHNYTDEMEYRANLVLVSPTDFFLNLVSAKDEQGRPLYPQAGLFKSVTIGGITIRPWSKIPAGKIFVADMKMMHIVNYIPFSIRIGWINDQFITNQFTMVGESRYFQYVKKLDEQAFIYDDFATIKTAIAVVP
jgi:HK97 family phage major capsid protein